MKGDAVNIVVLVKQVPDTATRIQDRIAGGRLDLDGVTWVVNPYDEYAVEEALRIKERQGGTVTLLGLGPDRVDMALKDMLALGADEAIHLKDPAFEGLGARGRAQVLAAAIRKLPQAPDMVWAGWKGVDEDQGLVPIYLAQELGWPHLSFVVELNLEGGRAKVRREVEGGKELLDAPLPAVITAQKGLNEVRYASLKGIMAVKRKVIPIWDAAALDLEVGGLAAGGVAVERIERPADRPPGRILQGTPAEAAAELVRLLRTEAKVI
jgi:electron transfer flavoprotein beta subunit